MEPSHAIPQSVVSQSGSPSDSAPEQVAQALRRRILSGEIAPGTPLREVALSREYKISRNTFRDTIRLLLFEGLVHHAPNRGAVVARLGAADARDIYEVRRVLETAAVARAVTCRPVDLRPLGTALADLERAAERKHWQRLVETDLAFHRALVDVLGSIRLSALFATMAGELRLAFSIVAYADSEYDDPEPLVEEHRKLFDAMVRGDLAVATSLVTEHLEKYESRCLAVLGDGDALADRRRVPSIANRAVGDA